METGISNTIHSASVPSAGGVALRSACFQINLWDSKEGIKIVLRGPRPRPTGQAITAKTIPCLSPPGPVLLLTLCPCEPHPVLLYII